MSELRNRKAVDVSEDTQNLDAPSNGSVKGDPMLTPSSEKELAYASKEKQTSKKPVATPRNPKLVIIGTLIGGWILAVVFAIGHHFFAEWIDGQTVPDAPTVKPIIDFQLKGQDSIKTAATAFVRFVVLSLTVAAGGVLTQMAWRVPRRHSVPLEKMDLIFKLPALGPAISLIFSPWIRWVAFTMVLVLCIHGLEAVTMITPQSLKVVPRNDSFIQTQVPSLDLSNVTVKSADLYSQGYIRPSAAGSSVVQDTMITLNVPPLPQPKSCSTIGCEYSITYNAPALQCRTLTAGEINITAADPTNTTPTLYQGYSTLWTLRIPAGPDTAPPSNQLPYITERVPPADARTATEINNLNYTFNLQWQRYVRAGQDAATDQGPLKGIECQFFEGVYKASIKFNGTEQISSTSLQSVGSPFIGANAYQSSSCTNFNLTKLPAPDQPCWRTAVNYRSIAEAFSELLVGMVWYDDSGRISVYRSAYLIPFLKIDTTITSDNKWQWSFDIDSPDIGSTLQQLLGNVTLAMISTRSDVANVDLTVYGAGNVWEYDWKLLWGIYAPTLGVFALFIAYGLWCIHVDGAMDKGFVDLFIATRSETIDKALEENESIEEIKGMMITSVKHGVFKAVGLDGLVDA